jgi:micrococcal nuclease
MVVSSLVRLRPRSPTLYGVFLTLFLVLAIVLGGSQVSASDPGLTATVDYAKSGQTLELLFEISPDLPITSVRLEGVQAPDREQAPWGEAARECLADLLPTDRNRVVRLVTRDWTADAYGRLWAFVWNGRTLLNQALLSRGCAYLASDRLAQSDHYIEMLYAQEQARLLGLGIWQPENPLRESAEAFRRGSDSP